MPKDRPIVLIASELEKEAARVAGKIFGRSADGVMDVAGNFFGGIIGDRVKEWRTRRLIEHLARTAELLRERGISLEKAKALPMGEAYSMFEEASKQDDPTVSEMWSALLANAMDQRTDVHVEPAFVATLRNIGGAEAHVLKFVYDFRRERSKILKRWGSAPIVAETMEHAAREAHNSVKEKFEALKNLHLGGLEGARAKIATANLVRERCLFVPAPVYHGNDIIGTRRRRGEDDIVDPAKIEDALNEIASSTDEHSGRTDMVPRDLLKRNAQPIDLHYAVTDFGQRLVKACDPTAPTLAKEGD